MNNDTLSFEYFPPRNLGQRERYKKVISDLAQFRPDFISITHGANGSANTATEDAISIAAKCQFAPIVAHLTSGTSSESEILETAKRFRTLGASGYLALRGDRKSDDQDTNDKALSSVTLIEQLAQNSEAEIHCAAYVNPHPDSVSATLDLVWLKKKVDAGATSIITQFFFHSEEFLRFRDTLSANNIKANVIAGILPIKSFSQVQRFAGKCNVPIPVCVADAFSRAETAQDQRLLATAIATELMDDLLSEGHTQFHMFTMNEAKLTADILHALPDWRAKPMLKAVG